MSIGKISAAKFFAENGLFKLLEHKDGDITKSYKTKNQEYIMECENCGQQVEQRGNAEFECRRCRYSVAPIVEDNAIAWKIKEPTGLKKKRADEAMEKPAKVLIGKEVVTDDSDDDDEVVIPDAIAKKVVQKRPVPKKVAVEVSDDDSKPPSAAATIAFLKKTAPKVSGERITTRKKAHTAEQEADIDEPVAVAKKVLPQKPKEEVPKETSSTSCAVVAREVTMKVISLKPGQTHYCSVTNTLYMGAPE